MGSISDAITIRKRKFDVDEHHQFGEAGILGEDDRIELIEGELVEMAPIGGTCNYRFKTQQDFFAAMRCIATLNMCKIRSALTEAPRHNRI
jgi:hypothetical protein